jgi:N-methylhydantoinase A
LEAGFRELEATAAAALPGGVVGRFADMRYAGQSFELRVPVEGGTGELRERFEAEHERTYGHRNAGDPVEVVHLRAVATAERDEGGYRWEASQVSQVTQVSHSRPAYFGGGLVETAVVGRGDVGAGPTAGPLIVEEYDATTVVPPGWTVRRDGQSNLVLER